MIDIIQGHLHELVGNNESISKPRLQICDKCPLKKITFYGAICNDKLWIDTASNLISTKKLDGYVKGCGCRLSAKTRLANAKCPAGKW